MTRTEIIDWFKSNGYSECELENSENSATLALEKDGSKIFLNQDVLILTGHPFYSDIFDFDKLVVINDRLMYDIFQEN